MFSLWHLLAPILLCFWGLGSRIEWDAGLYYPFLSKKPALKHILQLSGSISGSFLAPTEVYEKGSFHQGENGFGREEIVHQNLKHREICQ